MRTITVLAMGIVFAMTAGSGVLAQGMPQAVRSAVQDMDQSCREAQGTPGDKSGLIKSADWNGDGVRDWALDEIAYVCTGSAGLFSGSAGGAIDVWAGTAGGGVAEPAYFSGFGATLDAGKLWLSVEGMSCGQTNTDRIAHVDYRHCERSLAWDGRKFVLAPLSEVRPIGTVSGRTAPQAPTVPVVSPRPAPAGGVSTAWLTGVWVAVGQHCDSGASEYYHADGILTSDEIEGHWRLDGDVFSATYHTVDIDDTKGPDQTTRHRVARLGQDRLTLTPVGRGAPVTMTRCG
ncbi:hypothetical protein BH10PSE2_BH10PSE2_23340 [soil metagenome]